MLEIVEFGICYESRNKFSVSITNCEKKLVPRTPPT